MSNTEYKMETVAQQAIAYRYPADPASPMRVERSSIFGWVSKERVHIWAVP